MSPYYRAPHVSARWSKRHKNSWKTLYGYKSQHTNTYTRTQTSSGQFSRKLYLHIPGNDLSVDFGVICPLAFMFAMQLIIRCLRWDSRHAQAYTSTAQLRFFPNLSLTRSLQALTNQTDSWQTNVVTEVKLLVSQSDYERTTCIIRFLGRTLLSDIEDSRRYPVTAPTHCSGQ